MLSRLKATAKSSVIYGIGNLSTKVIGLILLPLYTSTFPTGEFGMFAMLELTSQVIITFFGLGLYNAFFRWYWEKEYADKQKSLFFTVIVFLTAVSIIMTTGLFLASRNLASLLLENGNYFRLIRLMVLTSAFEIIGVLPLTLMRIQEKPGLFISANILKFVVNLFLTLYLILGLKHRIEGIYEAQIIGNIVFFFFLSGYIYRNIDPKFNRKALGEMLNFSAPIVFASIAGILLNLTDRYALKFIDGLDKLGSYQFGFKIANAIKIIVLNSVNYALSPIIYKIIDEKGSKRFYSKILTYVGFGVMILVLLISFFGKEITMILARDKEYWNAYTVIPILAFGLFFGSLRDTVYTGLNISKKTKVAAAIIVTASVINIGLNIILINLFSSIGAAIASAVSQLIYLLLVWNYSQKYFYISYETGKIIKVFSTGAVLSLAAFFANGLPLVAGIAVKMILVALFPIILYYWNFFEEIELERLKGLWLKWRNPDKWIKNIKGDLRKEEPDNA